MEGKERKKRDNRKQASTPKAQWYNGVSPLIKGTEAAKARRMREIRGHNR